MVDMTKIEPEPLKDRQITRAELAARRAGVNTN